METSAQALEPGVEGCRGGVGTPPGRRLTLGLRRSACSMEISSVPGPWRNAALPGLSRPLPNPPAKPIKHGGNYLPVFEYNTILYD